MLVGISNSTEATAKAAAKLLPSESGSILDEDLSAQGSTDSVHFQEVASIKPALPQATSRGGLPPPSHTAAILQQKQVSSMS